MRTRVEKRVMSSPWPNVRLYSVRSIQTMLPLSGLPSGPSLDFKGQLVISERGVNPQKRETRVLA